MSAATMAAAPLRRRALERKGMTPEEELDLLIREQQADDTYFIGRPEGDISLDVPAPGGCDYIRDLIGVDEDGELFIGSAARSSISPIKVRLGSGGVLGSVRHGTIYGYRRQRCRCCKCRKAQADSVREYRTWKKSS